MMHQGQRGKAKRKTGFVRWSQLVTLKGSFTRPLLGKHAASGEMSVSWVRRESG